MNRDRSCFSAYSPVGNNERPPACAFFCSPFVLSLQEAECQTSRSAKAGLLFKLIYVILASRASELRLPLVSKPIVSPPSIPPAKCVNPLPPVAPATRGRSFLVRARSTPTWCLASSRTTSTIQRRTTARSTSSLASGPTPPTR
jgi:hypothetical protein